MLPRFQASTVYVLWFVICIKHENGAGLATRLARFNVHSLSSGVLSGIPPHPSWERLVKFLTRSDSGPGDYLSLGVVLLVKEWGVYIHKLSGHLLSITGAWYQQKAECEPGNKANLIDIIV